MRRQKETESRKAEVKSFTKPKSTIMIEGQKDPEAGEVTKEEKGLLDSKRKSWKKKHQVRDKKLDSLEKLEQERETYEP